MKRRQMNYILLGIAHIVLSNFLGVPRLSLGCTGLFLPTIPAGANVVVGSCGHIYYEH